MERKCDTVTFKVQQHEIFESHYPFGSGSGPSCSGTNFLFPWMYFSNFSICQISINPRGAKIPANTVGFFIAQSAEEVKRYTLSFFIVFCTACFGNWLSNGEFWSLSSFIIVVKKIAVCQLSGKDGWLSVLLSMKKLCFDFGSYICNQAARIRVNESCIHLLPLSTPPPPPEQASWSGDKYKVTFLKSSIPENYFLTHKKLTQFLLFVSTPNLCTSKY